MVAIKSVILFFFITLLLSCFHKSVYDYGRRNNSVLLSKELRLDGYYYLVDSSGTPLTRMATRYFLFKDGKMVHAFSCLYSELFTREKEFFTDKYVYPWQDTTSYNWMYYDVHNDSIFYNRIYPQEGYPHYFFRGVILNDTTFLITKEKHGKHGKEHRVQDTFHFRELDMQSMADKFPIKL